MVTILIQLKVVKLLQGFHNILFCDIILMMIESMVQWAFYFTIEPTLSHILTIGGIVVGMAIALTPLGMRRIYKMNLVEKIKDLSQ